MPFSDSPLVAGNVMLWSEVAENFTDARVWMNAILNTDITAATIEREHLVRPVISGSPPEYRSTFQQAHRATQVGLDPATPLAFTKWGPFIKRVTIVPFLCRGASSDSVFPANFARWVLPIQAFLAPVRTCQVRVVCQFDLQVRNDPGGPAFYPNGGTGTRAGAFRIVVRDRSDNTEVLRQIRNVYPLDSTLGVAGATIFLDHVRICTTFQLLAGEYDIALVYYRGNGADLVDQLDLTCISMHTEVI